VREADDEGIIREGPWFKLTQRLGLMSPETVDEWVLDAAHTAASLGVVGIVDLEMGYCLPTGKAGGLTLWSLPALRGIRHLSR